jgi:S1-C subfamily serine protease
MSITGKLSADGLVYLTCPKPDCAAELRVKPKNFKTTVTCASCGHKFALEVANMDASAGPGAPPPLPLAPAKTDDNPLRFEDEDKPAPASPKRGRPKQPWDVDDHDRRTERRRENEENKTAPIGLIVGGVIAAVLIIGGIAVGAVYVLREPSKGNTPVATGPSSERNSTTAALTTSGTETSKPAATTTLQPATTSVGKNLSSPPPMKEMDEEAVVPVVDTDPKPPEPAPATEQPPPPKGKTPPKKKGTSTGTPAVVGPYNKNAIDKVKKSTALIESKGGWGTGFVIRPGIVMTNAHVIKGSMLTDLTVSFVTLDDTAPPKLKPTLLYTDPRRDLAILRVDTDRPPLEMTEAGTELSGLGVAIVGNPKGDAGQAEINKVTTGKLSAPIRRDAGWTYYELSAQAYFGNSGGPVVDAKTGNLVGVIQSILGDGKQKSYCIPFNEALRAINSLPASKEDEPKATKIAQARHYLDYIADHLPGMELDAEGGMVGQLNKLRAKASGGDVTVTVRTTDGRRATMSLTEYMTLMKERHNQYYPNFNKVLPMVSGSSEIPSSLKQLMRERIETYDSMYSLANQSTKTEKAFKDAMDSRKAANVSKAKAFKEAYDKFLDDLERSLPATKSK